MGRALISRQPIYRSNMSPIGYELLFRDDDTDRASFGNEDEATAQVIVNTFMEIGLEEMVGPHLAFINVSRQFLLSDFCEALPADRVVFELLEPIDLDPDLMKRVKQLVSGGYNIAVGDFAFQDKFRPLLEAAAVVKFDIMSGDWNRIEKNLSTIYDLPMKRVAEKVESAHQFKFCQAAGFDFFQGYFFCRPEFVRSERLPLSRLMTLRLIGKLNNPDLSIDELEQAIRQDLSLSYKLLRYVGSAGCATRGQIQSIRHAAVLVGIERMKIWAALILFSGLEENMRELTITAVVRARMCEKLAEAMHLPGADQFFLVGLFSVLDSMLNRPLAEILDSLNLTPEINRALLFHEGIFSLVLECVIAYERRDWKNVRCGDLDFEAIRTVYVRAMAWSIRTLNGFSDAIESEILKQETSRHLRRQG